MHYFRRWFVEMSCVVALSLMPSTSVMASEMTHVWTIGDVTNRVGLLGIKDGVGKYRTEILYGPGWNEYLSVPLHIYTFVLVVLFVVVVIGYGFWVLSHPKKRPT